MIQVQMLDSRDAPARHAAPKLFLSGAASTLIRHGSRESTLAFCLEIREINHAYSASSVWDNHVNNRLQSSDPAGGMDQAHILQRA